MKEIVEKLVKLQDYDNRLHDLTLRKGDLPQMIESLDDDLQHKRETSSELKEKTDNLQKDRKMFEQEAQASKAQLKKYEEQLYSVQNNKEYDAISLEIDTKKAEIEGLENKIIQTLESEEALKKELSELEGDMGDLDSQLSENREQLDEIDQQTKTEEARLVTERDKLAKKLDDRHLRQYQRIQKAKNGLAVVPISKGSCGGCFSAIPPQRIVEIRNAERLFSCENCGRILVWVD